MVAEGLWQWLRRSHSSGHGGGEGEVKVVAMEAEEVLRWKPRRVRVLTPEAAKDASPQWLDKN